MLDKAPVIEICAYQASVKRWGVADRCNLRPGSRLLFKQAARSDLLLMRPKGAGGIKLARYFGSTLLSEPHGKPMSQSRWQIHAGVFAIETPLDGGAICSGLNAVKAFNTTPELAKHINGLPLIDEVYLAELLTRIHRESPLSSVVIASSRQQLLDCEEIPPAGCIWLLPEQERFEASSTSPWLAPMHREKVRAASKMMRPRHKRYCQMHLPGLSAVSSQDSLASK